MKGKAELSQPTLIVILSPTDFTELKNHVESLKGIQRISINVFEKVIELSLTTKQKRLTIFFTSESEIL